MTDKLKAAAEMALEAIDEGWLFEDIDKKVAPALRQALAEWTPDDTAYRPDGLSQEELPAVKSYCGGKPNYCEPELVGYVYQNELQGMTLGAYSCTEIYPDDSTGRIPLYTAPPKRDWVSLTDEEIAQAVGSPIDEVYLSDFRKVEAKLKEKNNG